MSGGLPAPALAGVFAEGGVPKDIEGAIRLLALAQMQTSLAIMAMSVGQQEDSAARLSNAFERAVKAFEKADTAMKKLGG